MQHDPSVFKDKVGRFRTQSLFREMNYGTNDQDPIYTLKAKDPQGKLPSLKDVYMECADPTEYEFAMAAFGSWQHWEALCKLSWMEAYVLMWRDELEVKLRSEAIKVIINETKEGKAKYNAAKFLSDGGWKPKASKGRPSEAEITRETKVRSKVEEAIEEDLERVMGNA
jgi:hypothetical protein